MPPNPSFETLCSGNTTPCNWTSGPGPLGVVVTSDAMAPTGACSMRLTTNPGYSGQGANSDCITSPAPATYTLAFWYHTPDAAAAGADVGSGIYQFDVAGCASAPSQTNFDTTPMLAEGQWHQVTRPVTLGSGPTSAFFVLGEYCVCQVRYDDFSFDSATSSLTPVVPELPTPWLFLSGLLALVWFSRHGRR